MVKIRQTGFLKLNFETMPKNAFSGFCQKFVQATDEVEIFFCQFPNPWALKGTVQRELRWVKIGINRTARINCIAGKRDLLCPKGHHHERSLNVIGGCSTF
jgi:hypothetical protein